VIICAYNHHVRLLPPEPVVVKQPKLLGSRGSALSCNQIRTYGLCLWQILNKLLDSTHWQISAAPRLVPLQGECQEEHDC
jgi:hypothetical protein